MNLVITGATGDVGSRVVKQLIARGERPLVFVRDANKARALFGEAVEIRSGDLGDQVALGDALAGSDALFLVTSGPQIPVLDAIATAAAKAAKVEHLVKLSSLDVEQRLAIGAWHERGEEAIRAGGVSFTFLAPSGFMTNLLAWAETIRSEGVLRSSTGSGKRAFIHPEDIAAVAVEALTRRAHLGDRLVITGPEALSFADITARIGAATGRELRYEAISDVEARRRFEATGASPEETNAHVELWRAIREDRLGMVTAEIERVLGRKPMTMDRWIRENVEAFGPRSLDCRDAVAAG